MVDLSLLRHFVAAVEAGSFTQASERLHISQSGISRSISRLEDELGIVLLERTTRKLRLTPAGDALYAETVASLNRLAVAVDNARRIGKGVRAKLRIGICDSAVADAHTILLGLQAFQKIWPDVELIFSAVIGVHQPNALRASEIDLGVMQMNRADCHDLDWQVLSQTPLMVAVPSSWGIRTNRLRLEDLKECPWLVPHPELATTAYEGVMHMFHSAGITPTIARFVNDRLTAHIMLGCGIGAALVHSNPSSVQTDGYELIPLDTEGRRSHVETVMAWASASTSEQVAGLAGCVRDVIGNA